MDLSFQKSILIRAENSQALGQTKQKRCSFASVCVCICAWEGNIVHSQCSPFSKTPLPHCLLNAHMCVQTQTHTHAAVLSPASPNESVIKATWPMTFSWQPQSQTPQPPLFWLTGWLSDKLHTGGQKKTLRNADWCFLLLWSRGVKFSSTPDDKKSTLALT